MIFFFFGETMLKECNKPGKCKVKMTTTTNRLSIGDTNRWVIMCLTYYLRFDFESNYLEMCPVT